MTQTTAGTAGMIIAEVFASASSLPRVMYGHPARGARVDAGDTPTDAVVPHFLRIISCVGASEATVGVYVNLFCRTRTIALVLVVMYAVRGAHLVPAAAH